MKISLYGYTSAFSVGILFRRLTSRNGICTATSALPDSSMATRAEESGTNSNTTRLISGLGPQYLSKASSTTRDPRS
ncbi:hypothetical protein D3C87_2064930 [compost metagenome]